MTNTSCSTQPKDKYIVNNTSRKAWKPVSLRPRLGPQVQNWMLKHPRVIPDTFCGKWTSWDHVGVAQGGVPTGAFLGGPLDQLEDSRPGDSQPEENKF